MKEVSGIVTSVSGEGFVLETGPRKESFVVGMDAVLEAGALPDLADKHLHVTVQYHDIEASHVAIRIFPAMRPQFRGQAH